MPSSPAPSNSLEPGARNCRDRWWPASRWTGARSHAFGRRAARDARASGSRRGDHGHRRRAGRRRGRGPASRRQPVHARRGRMDALLQRVEVEAVRAGHHQLGVDDASLGQARLQRRDQLREVAGERAFVAAAQHDLVAVAEHDAAEAVPLRFVQPAVASGGSSSAALASIGETGGITGSRTTAACADREPRRLSPASNAPNRRRRHGMKRWIVPAPVLGVWPSASRVSSSPTVPVGDGPRQRRLRRHRHRPRPRPDRRRRRAGPGRGERLADADHHGGRSAR